MQNQKIKNIPTFSLYEYQLVLRRIGEVFVSCDVTFTLFFLGVLTFEVTGLWTFFHHPGIVNDKKNATFRKLDVSVFT
jgi:hypothetical protein